MTERSFGKSLNHWIGKVTNVNDPDMDGRVQVRILGLHDDQSNIPDSDLLWAKPGGPISSASHNKIGQTPVGVIVGSYVEGHWQDVDMQIPVWDRTYAKAGDPDTSNNASSDGQIPLKKGTNSSPLGGRIANNAFVTRRGKDITKDDQTGSQGPQEQNDSDGVDVTAEAQANTKYGSHPTIGSISTPSGSILQQIAQIDPQNVANVLPNALAAFTRIKDLNEASTTGGVNGILGQAIGLAGSQLGSSAISALTQLEGAVGLTAQAQTVLQTALSGIQSGFTMSQLSANMQSVVGQSLPALVAGINQLVSVNGLTATAFNTLVQQFFPQMQNNAAQQVLGVVQNNILNQLQQFVPQIAGAIQSTLNGHLPQSVLNSSNVNQALQRFAMAQAFLKANQGSTQGKKQLAIQATTGPVTP